MKSKTEFDPKTFAVIGAGPVGSILAAFLAKGEYEVILCDVMPDLLKPATDPGIIIEGAENLQQAVHKTCTNVSELADYKPDVIFVTVKANALSLIASVIQEFYKPGMYVVSWQNGIDTELELAKKLTNEPVMRAVVNYGCGLIAPGHVKMPFHHTPHNIEELDPKSSGTAKIIADILTRCGLETEYTDQIIHKVWRKSILNACMNPVCAVTGLTMAQVMGDPIVRNIVEELVRECSKVARANEIKLGWNFFPYAMEYMGNAGNHKPSMLMDIQNKRRTEVDFINGKFIEYGKRAAIETPYNTSISALVKGLESRIAS